MDFTSHGTINEVVAENQQIVGYKLQEAADRVFKHQDLRLTKQTAMQLSSSKPVKNEFFEECEDGKNYVIPFGGVQGRDNLYHPKCTKLTDPVRELYLNHILQGFPQTIQEEEYYQVSQNSDYDTYSGVFRKGTIVLNSPIRTKLPNKQELIRMIDEEAYRYAISVRDEEGYINGRIVNYTKTINKGLDNYIIYDIQIDNSDFIIHVSSNDFHPEYKQDRRWGGISGSNEEVKEKLIRCTEKLGLSQSPFTTERLQSELANSIKEQVASILRRQDPFYKTIVLCGKTIRKLTERPYVAIPTRGIRSILYVTESATYCIMQTDKVIQFDYIGPNSIYDGYISKGAETSTNWVYQPIDCLWPQISKDYLPEPKEPSEYQTEKEYFAAINRARGRLPNMNLTIRPKGRITGGRGLHIHIGRTAPDCNVSYDQLGSMIGELPRIFGSGDCIVFVPQTGTGSWLWWGPRLIKPIILEISKEKTVSIPMPEGPKMVVSPKIPVDIVRRAMRGQGYLKFWLNIRPDGSLSQEEPVLLDQTEPISNTLPPPNQDILIQTMLSPIPESVFQNPTEWRIGNIRLRSVGGTQPLQIVT
jgi:hypothetical protein